MPAEAARFRRKLKLRAFIDRYLKRKPVGEEEESLHSVNAPETQRLLEHDVNRTSRSMDGHDYAEAFCELNELLAWLDVVKVRGRPAGLERRGDITRKIVEVELRAEWRKYALEHRREHATGADRDDIIMKVEQLDRLLRDLSADCRLRSFFSLAEG